MRKIKWTPVIVTMMIIALATTLSYVGCGGSSSSSSGSSAATVNLGAAVSAKGMVTFGQNVVAQDLTDGNGFNVPFPGQGNYWDIDTNFSLADGADDQFDSALELAVSGTNFASNQTYNELTWMSPAFGTGDGIKVAGVITSSYSGNYTSPISGLYSATLNTLTDARLMQTINLAGATTPITLTYSYDYDIYSGAIATTDTAYFKLVIRNTGGTVLETIYDDTITDTSTSNSASDVTADLSAYAGQSIVLSFEARYSRYDWSGYCVFDAVSVKGNNGTEYVTNGDFETGNLNGWSTNNPVQYQNLTSGSRNITGTGFDMTITRSFFTSPNKLWGRWVDVFENNTITATSVVITYTTNLGNDYNGYIYTVSGTSGKALASWDGSGSDRDIGMVFGTADAVTFSSAVLTGSGVGGITVDTQGTTDDIYVAYAITVTPGSRVALVNFIIMDGVNTSLTAATPTTKATAIDTEALNIVNNFWTDVQYREGMTQEQINAVLNFLH